MLRLSEIAGKLECRSSATRIKEDCEIRHLLIDSRSLESPEDTLFFAIPTKKNDGHRFVRELYDRGVRNFIVNYIPEDAKECEDANFLVVADTVAALQKVTARKNRRPEILAITGSRGKTTLKEWIYQLMEPLAEISRSPRSYNSQIGVPLSMWELDEKADLGIIEAGISRKGEMSRIAECIKPDTVIITNIGEAHNEGFSSPDEKAEEKALLAATEATECVIFNKDSHIISKALGRIAPRASILAWSISGHPEAELKATVGASGGKKTIEYSFHDVKSSIEGPFETDIDIENAMNALAFMLHRGLSPKVIAERFSKLHKIGTRLNVTEGVNGCSIILDSYTSDFSSLRPALDFLKRRKTPNQSATLILSDIHHESGSPEQLYGDIARLLHNLGITRFIGVGPALISHKDIFPEGSLFFDNTSALLESLSPSDFNSEAILLKGSPEYDFGDIAEMLEARKHETVLEVNLDALVRNYNYFRKALPQQTGIVCMVKASGYGAGSYEIAKTLQDAGAAYLAVAVLDEGIELRQRGITMPIMVMNPKVVNYKSMFANSLEPEIYSFDMLHDVIREAEKNGIEDYPVHIKLDTGMHRMGFIEPELAPLMDILNATRRIEVRSVFSHLATADCPDMDDYTDLQLARFREYTGYMLARSRKPFMRHILNSAGILRYGKTDHYDMARLGIGLYGANTLPPEMEKPLDVVSTLRTVIIALREWDRTQTIGYGRRGELKRPSRIATIPIGYADGINRHFGLGAVSMTVNGKEAPTVGNICMDACMIDVTGIDCKVGDPVEIFGPNAPLQRLADALDTIPYEILTSVSPRVKRIYYRE